MIQIDSLCESFEAEWTSGRSPSIEAYLVKVAELMRPELLRELLGLELSCKLTRGDLPSPDEYRRRFPQYRADVDETLNKILAGAARPATPSAAENAPLPRVTGTGSTLAQELDETFSASDARFAAKTLDPASGSSPSSASAAAPLTAIGRYELGAQMGRGASGVVYRAWDPRLSRHVAVKVLHERVQKPGAFDQRLAQEAHAATRLKHPHIVAVLDGGVTEAGDCFIVMDFVEGRTFHQVLRERKTLPVNEAVELVSKLADAIAEAHRQQIYHRDLKPGNVLVDATGKPCIVDFGMAVNESTQRSRRGELAGTWAYMSPEQLHGDAHLLDGRSDIWALGVILYEAIAGKRPFGGKDLSELSEEIYLKDPTPLRQLNSSLPAELDGIIKKALAKNPAERYAAAQDLANDLRQLNQPKPPLNRQAERRLWLETAGVTLVSVVVSLFGIALLSGYMTPQRSKTFAPKLDWDPFNSTKKSDLAHNDRDNEVYDGQYVSIHVRNEDPVYMYVFLIDEKGKSQRIIAADDKPSVERERDEFWSKAIKVEGNPGTVYLVAAVSEKPLAPDQLSRLDGQNFGTLDRGTGDAEDFVEGPPMLIATLNKMVPGVLKAKDIKSFKHVPRQ